jgi:hypothetical protein
MSDKLMDQGGAALMRLALVGMPFQNPVRTEGRAEGWESVRFCNPKGIVSSSPRLRGTSYLGLLAMPFLAAMWLRQVSGAAPQPRWVCLSPDQSDRAGPVADKVLPAAPQTHC